MAVEENKTKFWMSAYAFGLGCGYMLAFVFLLMDLLGWWPLWLYLVFLTMFHQLEFSITAYFNPLLAGLDSYLIDHSMEYHLAHVIALSEFFVERWLMGPSASASAYGIGRWLGIVVGVGMAVAGQALRSIAMTTAKQNFTHQIATTKRAHHQLVTDGIYAWVRHPSYLGFWLWAVGLQLLLGNPVTSITFAVFLTRWFSNRIAYEEVLLEDFFGTAYVDYRKRVSSGIPFVP